jgi:hypothetical protein
MNDPRNSAECLDEHVRRHYAEIGRLLKQGNGNGERVVTLVTLVQYDDGKVYAHLSGHDRELLRLCAVGQNFFRAHAQHACDKYVYEALMKGGGDNLGNDPVARLELEKGL